uniref:Uncharacterized protein n=1 Tax=Triticum urartu TaxID=4572 RepID=A0A8R7PW59_TRIUA
AILRAGVHAKHIQFHRPHLLLPPRPHPLPPLVPLPPRPVRVGRPGVEQGAAAVGGSVAAAVGALAPVGLPRDAATVGGAEEAEVEAAPTVLVGEIPAEALGHLLERPVAVVVDVVELGGSGARAPTRRGRRRRGRRAPRAPGAPRPACPHSRAPRPPSAGRTAAACPASGPCACQSRSHGPSRAARTRRRPRWPRAGGGGGSWRVWAAWQWSGDGEGGREALLGFGVSAEAPGRKGRPLQRRAGAWRAGGGRRAWKLP